jgi:hypothetical protein
MFLAEDIRPRQGNANGQMGKLENVRLRVRGAIESDVYFKLRTGIR